MEDQKESSMKQIDVTDEQIKDAVKSSANIDQALSKLGYSKKDIYAYKILDRISQLEISTAHFRRASKKRWTDEQLIEAVKSSHSMAQVLLKLGYTRNSGGIYTFIKGHIKKLGIDCGHWTGQGHLKGKTHNWSPAIPFEIIMVENSTYNCHKLKTRLFKASILENKCSECGLLPEWNGKPISLQMDHINGDHHDNRLENLRILCPNCHSQTDTFGTRNLKRQKPKQQCARLPKIGCRRPRKTRLGPMLPTPAELDPNWRHRPKPDTRKVVRPSKEELLKLLWEVPTMKLADQLGVSDQAIAKWAKLYGIEKPPRGYWAKQNAKQR
jgi:hypothetical protein